MGDGVDRKTEERKAEGDGTEKREDKEKRGVTEWKKGT
jgi:hypothetical protein